MSLQRDIWLLGGPQMIQAFRELGTVDSYEIYVMPVLLGDGISLFLCSDAMTSLHLTDHHVFRTGWSDSYTSLRDVGGGSIGVRTPLPYTPPCQRNPRFVH
jgi:riboflavin biosynthesis pyrimidine reductase